MTLRTPIDITELDFDALKASLVRFLKTQDEFKDYNFEGASMNILLDILAANSTYYATYMSFIGNESFLDSAILRSSIVSRAKERGYVPRSARASKISVGMKVEGITNSPSSLNIFKDTKFNGVVNGESVTFTTIANQGLYPTNILTGTYEGIIDAYEGSFVTTQYNVQSATTRFILPNRDVDTSTMKVSVKESSTDNTISEFNYNENVITLTSTSKVYFLQEVDAGYFEIVFGDDVIGYKPRIGNIVIVEYLTCHPGKGNGVSTISLSVDLFPLQTTTLTLATSSSGGIVREPDADIKKNMKARYNSQDRAVIPSDYKTITAQLVPEIIDVNVWGGEDNVPPSYGKTIISVITSSFEPIPAVKKRSIENIIRQKNVTGIRPVVIDAETYRIKLSGRVRVKRELMNIPDENLITIIKNTIGSFSSLNLERFAKNFTYSMLTTDIDNAHVAVIGSLFDIYLVNKLYPDRTITSSYKVLFNNPISNGSVTCSPFYIPFSRSDTIYYIEDVNGYIKIFGITAGDITTKAYESGYFGTVNYTTGEVVIAQVQPTPAIHAIEWTIEVKIDEKDVDAKFNQVLFLDENISTINVITI